MILLGNEAGANLYMTGDGHIGEEKFLCVKGYIAQIKSTRKSKRFTVIGITNLLGEPICFIVIIEGKEIFFYIWYGIYLSKG